MIILKMIAIKTTTTTININNNNNINSLLIYAETFK